MKKMFSVAANQRRERCFSLVKSDRKEIHVILGVKMASRPLILKMSQRFVDVGSDDNFISEQGNKATFHKKQRDVRLLQTFLRTRNELRKVEEIPALGLRWLP